MKKVISLIMALSLMVSLVSVSFATAITTSNGANSSDKTNNSTGFIDVPKDAWYAESVMYCKEHGLMSGTGNDKFSPDTTCTRGMIIAILWRACGEPTVSAADMKDGFDDVDPNAYYAKAVYWARKEGIMSGFSKTEFGPNSNITREQIVTILWRYLGSKKVTAESFADADQISSYAKDAVNWARRTGVVAGKGNNMFDPKGVATRAQVAAIFYRFIESPN